jgi:hypothetical protein
MAADDMTFSVLGRFEGTTMQRCARLALRAVKQRDDGEVPALPDSQPSPAVRRHLHRRFHAMEHRRQPQAAWLRRAA